MMGTSIIVSPDGAGIAARALDLLIDGLRVGISRRGSAHLALTGGSSATALFERLRDEPRAGRVDWSRVHVWQGDERFVPLDHPDRNWAGALRDCIEHPAGPPIPDDQRHPIPVSEALAGGHGPDWAAARYAEEIERTLPTRDGIPAFDVVLLGVGGDGHILSTFPGSEPIDEDRRVALAVPAPTHIGPHLPRITLAPFLLRAAGLIVVMVPGSAKAEIVATCTRAAFDPRRLPAQLAILPTAVWLLDPGSAAQL